MKLTPVAEKFVLHWGEMGTQWGINRTVAQIHALLYISDKPLDAEEISETLAVSRSNVSTSLRELLSWGVIRPVRVLGERREFFESLEDVWEMLHRIALERKKREMDPTLSVLRSCTLEAAAQAESKHLQERLGQMLTLFETSSILIDRLQRIPPAQLPHLLKVAESLIQLVPEA